VVLGPGDRVPAGRTIRVEAQWTIDESGLVTSVQLLNSSGMRELDDEMVADLRRRVYRPALLDGVPIATWERTGGRKMRL
jgi:TonB family protein